MITLPALRVRTRDARRPESDGLPPVDAWEAGVDMSGGQLAVRQVAVESLDLRPYVGGRHCNGVPTPKAHSADGVPSAESQNPGIPGVAYQGGVRRAHWPADTVVGF